MAKSNTTNRRVNLYINGKEATTSIKEVRAEMQKLVNEQARMKIGSDEYIAHAKKIRGLKSILDEHKRQQQDIHKNWLSLSNMTDKFNKYFGMVATGVASITGIMMGFRKLSEDVAKMDDIYADVEKTTNLTKKEVKELNEEFKKMDTRTSREELNRLAADAGKLGITGKKDLLDFVDAGNQINVALGEDLGEGAIKNIGKITQVYKSSTKELESLDLKGQMLSVGSAINELGQSSTASEAYLVDFAQRLGGVAAQSGISIQNILGYASALDQSGQKVEMSATALQNFIMKLMADPAKFAQLAGQDVKEFTRLLQTDTNAAILTVLDALNNKGGFQALIPIFDEMGLDGARAVSVLSALATNINTMKEAQEVSNRGFSEATSITNEYSKKNDNLQAQLEKARKEFKEQALILGEKLNPMLLKSTNGFTYLVKALTKAPEFIKENRTLLIALGGALASYATVTAAAALQSGLLSTKTTILSGIKKAYNLVTLESITNKEREKVATQTYVAMLEKCITQEQMATLQKQGLNRNSSEYISLLEQESQKNLRSSEKKIKAINDEIATLEKEVVSKQKTYIASVNRTTQLRNEYAAITRTGNATKMAIVQKNLETSTNKQNAAATAYLTSTRELHTKKIQLESAAKTHNTLSTKLNTAGEIANNAAKQVLLSTTQKLSLATKALWVSMKANPLGWIISLVGFTSTAFSMFQSKTDKTAEATGELAMQVKNEGKQVNDLVSKLQNSNIKEDERKKILSELKNLQPGIVEGIDSEAIATGKLTQRVQEYNDELVKRIALAAKQDAVNEAVKKQTDAGVQLANLEAQARQELLNLQNKLPNLKIKKKTGDQSIWDWQEIATTEKEEIVSQFNKIFESNTDWFNKILDVQQLFPQSDSRSKKFGLVEFSGVDLSGINSLFESMKEIRAESKEAEEAVLAAQKEVENFKKTFANILNDTQENTGIAELIKEIGLMTDKQRLQELINHEDSTVQAAAQARLAILSKETSQTVDLIKLKEKELEEAQRMPGRTKEEIAARNMKIAAIEKEIKNLKKLGIVEDASEKEKNKQLQAAETLAKKIQEINNQVQISSLKEDEKEIMAAHNKFQELLSICQKYNLDATELYEAHHQEVSAIIDNQLEKSVATTIEAEERIQAALGSSSEKQKNEIRKRYSDLLALAQQHGIDTGAIRQQIQEKMDRELNGVQDPRGMQVLNISEEEWEEFEAKMNMALDLAGQLNNIWGQFNEFQNNRDKKELQDYEKNTNKKKELLNKQLDSGRISQEKYNAQVAQLDADLDKKKTEIARRQAKREKAQAIAGVITNTATAIMRIWADVPKFDFGISTGVLTAIAAATGAAQLATIIANPLPEYAQGGMTDGARVYIAGEAGREWIAPNNMLNDPITGPIIQQLELVRSGILSPEQLRPVLPDFSTMTSIPMYATGGLTGSVQNTTNYYQTSTEDTRLLETVQGLRDEIRIMNTYLSDPRNRQAYISNDVLIQNEKEMDFINHIKHL